MILSAPFGHVITLKTTISDADDCGKTTLVNSASPALPFGLPSKGANFCHTWNILLVGHQRRRAHALLQLYFTSSAASGCWSVQK
jgi:hypothetical protein